MKITFGIQPKHIERIETERKRWNGIELAGPLSDIEVDMIYSEEFWNRIAKEFGWHPFALALKYFEHLAVQPSPATPVEGEDMNDGGTCADRCDYPHCTKKGCITWGDKEPKNKGGIK